MEKLELKIKELKHIKPDKMWVVNTKNHILNQKAGKILKEQMEQTTNFLNKDKSLLESIVNALIEKERLTKKDLQEILPPIKNQKSK